jgi:hypothetical protein
MLDPQTRYYAVTGESIVEKSVYRWVLVGQGSPESAGVERPGLLTRAGPEERVVGSRAVICSYLQAGASSAQGRILRLYVVGPCATRRR